MKLKLPVEHRIQLKAEQYSDAELQACAMDVADIKRELESLRETRRRIHHQADLVICASVAVLFVIFAIRFFH